MNAIEVLTAARDHIAAPKGWTRRQDTRNVTGAPGGVAHCALGAIGGTWNLGSTDETRNEATRALARCIPDEFIVSFNDNAKTKKPVIAAFDAAIASLS